MSLMSTPPPPTGGLLPSGHEWDFSRTGVYWLDYLIDLVAIALVLAGFFLPLYLTRVHPHIKKLREDASAIRQQTENSHADAPHPNLRENIDANQREMRAGIAKALERMDALAEAITRLDAKQEIILQETKELRQDLWETKARVTALESRSPPDPDSSH